MTPAPPAPPPPLFPFNNGACDRRSSPLEMVTFLHAAGLLVFTAWDFAGETDFARLAICGWGSLAVPILAAAGVRRLRRRDGLPPAMRWLWPLVAFDALVLISTLNPSFTVTFLGGADRLLHTGAKPGWPSSARPAVTLQALWQFNAIYLTGFNLLLAVVRRRVLRALLFVFTVDTFALAVLGTFQKLDRASGLYFGMQPSPNRVFFSTFIYRNHWGAYVVLAIAAALGLLFHHARRSEPREQRHSPAFFGLVVTLFLAAAVPLSGSRSGTLLMLALLGGALLHWFRRLGRERRATGSSATAPALLAVALFAAGLAGAYLLGRPTIDRRIDTTREQIEEIRLRGGLGSRAQLYADTWRMAREKPWFGWGLGSYGTVFQMFNQQVSVEGWVPFYAEAHSDWLQALAEVGLAGTALIILMGAVPLAAVLRRGRPGPVTGCLLAGCGLLALYALVEFPFANPAVLEAFWLCFFAALRYHRLTCANS